MKSKWLGVLIAWFLGLAVSAQADRVFFPYIVSNPGTLATVVSVINTAAPGDVNCTAANYQLHYIYWWKGASLSEVCTESDFHRPTTQYDLVSFDVSGSIGGGEALFNDATNYDRGAGAPNFDLPTVTGQTDPKRGYLIVEHDIGCDGIADFNNNVTEGNLSGEVVVVDLSSGAAWGYQAVNDDNDSNGNYTGHPEAFDDGAANAVPVHLFPPANAKTRFFITPLVRAFDVDNNGTCEDSEKVANVVQRGNMAASVALLFDLDENMKGIFDRNENRYSGGVLQTVVCVGAVDVEDLISTGAWFNDQGGWAYFAIVDPTDASRCTDRIDTEEPAFVHKLTFGNMFGTGIMNAGWRLIN